MHDGETLRAASSTCSGNATVPVPRRLLQEVITDGCCPLHLRLQLARAVAVEDAAALKRRCLGHEAIIVAVEIEESSGPLATLDHRCLAAVAAHLPLAEVLTVRACSREPLMWAMQRDLSTQEEEEEPGVRQLVHDRIRARLWMRRIEDVTAGTKDETVFETRMRTLADEALRSRMETEMEEALAHMEDQIRAFQAEVDRRLEEQEQHVRRLVEERVQKELDAILASEVVKVQAMVEERVRERVSAIFRREVRETVRELQGKLDTLVEENELLRDAFAEANLRSKLLFWAKHPPWLHACISTSVGVGPQVLFSMKRRLMLV